jgi:HEAT repeat protein
MSRGPLLEVEALVSDATPGSESLLARELARRISRPGGSPDAKRFFCDQLSLLATGDHVPVLAKALAEPELFVSALNALQRIPGGEAREALLSELAEGPATRQVAILNSLASRREPEAVVKLAEMAVVPDPGVAAAACRALGRIGGETALNALARLETTTQGTVWLEVRQAQLAAAADLVRSGDMASLGPWLEKLLKPGEPANTRPLALLLAASRPGAETTQRLVQALRSDEPGVREAAVAGLRLAGNRSALPQAAAELDGLAPDTQIQVLSLIQETRTREALPQVWIAMRSLAGPARAAALETAAVLGDAETIGPLLDALPVRGEENRRPLARALAQLPGPGVDAALRARYDTSDAATQAALVDAIIARNAEGTPAFLERALGAESASVRSAAALGLAQVGDAEAVPLLLQRLATADEVEAQALETALAGICRRQGNLDPLRKTMAGANRAVNQRLLSVAAAVGGPQGLAMVSSQLDASDGEVALTALRLLSEWPDAAAFTALGQTVVQAKDVRTRTLALRGIARLAPDVKENGSAAAQTLQSLLAGANAAERRTLLTALGDLPRGAGVTALSTYQPDPETAGAAQQAAIKALESAEPTPSAEARKLLERSQGATSDPALEQRLAALSWKFSDLPNLARKARASSPTGLATDGQGGPAAAAVDGNPETYWDEVDQQPLYVIRVELERAATIRFLRIQGWKHHEYAPRDFEVWCDGRQVAKVQGAAYTQNWLTLGVEKAQGRTVELRIHGYYGASPAIRELEIRGAFNPDAATSGTL